jgi:erythromycin esterase-like protein
MARTISWLADFTGRPRMVVVWLHNDHARLGAWASPSGLVDAAGAHLRRRYGTQVYSVGLFMGTGAVANNSRVVRPMLPVPPDGIEALFARAGYPTALLDLRGHPPPALERWRRASQRYLRNGLAMDSLRPAREFDALVCVHQATPPSHRAR